MKPYASDAAFRAALEQRLLNLAREKNVNLARLRRQVIFERLLARLVASEPGVWVLKGGMALEARLGLAARTTKDVDLGLRVEKQADLETLTGRLTRICASGADDGFVYRTISMERLAASSLGDLARARLECRLAGREFGQIQLDIACRAHELSETEEIELHGYLRFAGIQPPSIEVVSVTRHVAEKFHGMLMQFDDRENTRTRDLADLVILHEHGLIDPARAAAEVRRVFVERATDLPLALPPFPAGWLERYERIASEHDIGASTFADARALIAALWAEMFGAARKEL
jgi:hypothetical protein